MIQRILMQIKAVSLDFGGTLAEGGMEWDSYHEAIRGYLVSHGYDITMGEMKQALRTTLQELERYRTRGLEKTFEEVYADFLRKLSIPNDDETLTELHEIFKIHYRNDLIPCVETIIPQLASRYKLALLSNTMSDQPKILLQRAGLDKYFSLLICSSDLGVRKPNPKIFQHIAENLGIKPQELVHVGDSVEADMYGARDAGAIGVWIKCPDQPPWNGYAVKSICELPSFLEQISG